MTKLQKKIEKKLAWKDASIWNYQRYTKWAPGIKDGARNHDKYIYKQVFAFDEHFQRG